MTPEQQDNFQRRFTKLMNALADFVEEERLDDSLLTDEDRKLAEHARSVLFEAGQRYKERKRA